MASGPPGTGAPSGRAEGSQIISDSSSSPPIPHANVLLQPDLLGWKQPIIAEPTGVHGNISNMYRPSGHYVGGGIRKGLHDGIDLDTTEGEDRGPHNQLTKLQLLEEIRKFDEIKKKLLEETRQTKYRNNLLKEIKRRKFQRILALLLTFLAFIETILIVTTMVKPVPQFALEGNLFYIQSLKADQYSKTKRDYVPLHSITTKTLHLAFDVRNTETETSILKLIPFRRRKLDTRQGNPKSVPATRFVAFWFGATGACLQQASGAIICSGGLTTDFSILYDQSRLPKTVVAALPSSTGLAPAGYLVGACLNAVFILYLTVVTLWPKWMWTPLRPGTTWDRRFQFTVGSVTFLTIGALAAFTISTIQLRNTFIGAVQSIPALDGDLIAQFDKGFNSLYGACVVGGIEVLGCLFLTWYARERDQKLNYKWAKAPASVKGNWNHAGSIMNHSEAGSGGISSAPSPGQDTRAWR